MTKPYVAVGDCTDLAIMYLKRANVHILDEDVADLAKDIAESIDSWFGDMKHLTPEYRPRF